MMRYARQISIITGRTYCTLYSRTQNRFLKNQNLLGKKVACGSANIRITDKAKQALIQEKWQLGTTYENFHRILYSPVVLVLKAPPVVVATTLRLIVLRPPTIPRLLPLPARRWGRRSPGPSTTSSRLTTPPPVGVVVLFVQTAATTVPVMV